VEGYEPNTYGDTFADVYDEWYHDVSDIEATVDVVAELAAGRPVLELGVGTGRLALPLAARGVEVHGIDASRAMLDRLMAKPGADALTLTLGDMADLEAPTPGYFGVVLVAFNTFFNLTSEAAQQRCLQRVADALAAPGNLAIEAFVPDVAPTRPEGALEVRSVELDRVRLTATWRDPADQTVAGQHIEIDETGVRLRPWYLRYVTPGQLDAMAANVGLELLDRWSGWDRRPFDGGAHRHVSVYLKPGHDG